MCHGHHDSAGHEGPAYEQHGHEAGQQRGRRGRRGRHGFPSRTQLVERLQGYQQHLEAELSNTRDLLDRLTDGPEQSGTV
ncbi:MAG: hypothetical protein H0X39_12505 [Actinobacteria bacterium]|nr:hypothetical protein [Actinomycetota bacterium]